MENFVVFVQGKQYTVVLQESEIFDGDFWVETPKEFIGNPEATEEFNRVIELEMKKRGHKRVPIQPWALFLQGR